MLTIRLDADIPVFGFQSGTERGHTRTFDVQLVNASWAILDASTVGGWTGVGARPGLTSGGNISAGNVVQGLVRNYNDTLYNAFGAAEAGMFRTGEGTPPFGAGNRLPAEGFRTHLFSRGDLFVAGAGSGARGAALDAMRDAVSATAIEAALAANPNARVTNGTGAAQQTLVNRLADVGMNALGTHGATPTNTARADAIRDAIILAAAAEGVTLTIAAHGAILTDDLAAGADLIGAWITTNNQTNLDAIRAQLVVNLETGAVDTLLGAARLTARNAAALNLIGVMRGAGPGMLHALNTHASITMLQSAIVARIVTNTLTNQFGDAAGLRGEIETAADAIVTGTVGDRAPRDLITLPANAVANTASFVDPFVNNALNKFEYEGKVLGDSLAYYLEVDYFDPSRARVTVFIGGQGVKRNDFIQIPVIGHATANSGVVANIINDERAGAVNWITVQNNIPLLSTAAGVGTLAHYTVGGAKSLDRNMTLYNNTVIIHETAASTFANDAAILLQAPAGFEFARNDLVLGNVPQQAMWNIHTQLPRAADGVSVQVAGNNARTHPLANVTLHDFGSNATIARIGYGSMSNGARISDADMMRTQLDRSPEREAPTIQDPGLAARYVDRTRIVISFTGLNGGTNNSNRGVIAIDGLVLVPTVAAILDPSIMTGDGMLRLSAQRVGNPANVSSLAVPGYTNVPGQSGIRASRVGGTVAIQPGQIASAGNNARILIEELNPGAWDLRQPLVFTLTDGAGNPLVGNAKLTGVIVDRNDNHTPQNVTTFLNYMTATTGVSATPGNVRGGMPDFANAGNATQQEAAGWFAGTDNASRVAAARTGTYINNTHAAALQGRAWGDYWFDNEGTRITFVRNHRMLPDGNEYWQTNLQQRFEFRVSVHPDFRDPIYVTISGSSMDGLTSENRFRLYTIQQRIDVVADTTPVGIGHQVVEVNSLTITERVSNALGNIGDRFNLSFTEFERPINNNLNFRFNPISVAANVRTTNMQVQLASNTGNMVVFRITERGNTGSSTGTVVINNMSVRADRNIPEGEYGISVNTNPSGNTTLNEIGTGGVLQNNVQRFDAVIDVARMLDRYEQLGYRVDDFILVTTQGERATGRNTVISFNSTGTTDNNFVMVNGVRRDLTIVNHEGRVETTPIINIGGTTFLPLRTLAEFMGARDAEILFTTSQLFNMMAPTVFVRLGDMEVAFFTETPFYTVNNSLPRTMTNVAGVPQDIILRNSTDAALAAAGGQRTYVPFRGFAQAFGIDVSHDDVNRIAWFNRPAGS
jgi:hypothetical protein